MSDPEVLPSRMGRTQIKIDEEEFIKLCEMLCTLNEIAAWFDCSPDTIQRWCMRTFEETFAAVYDKYSAKGKIALRRAMMREALGGNTTMQIWMSKQYLGMRDKDKDQDEKEDKGPIVIKMAYSLDE